MKFERAEMANKIAFNCIPTTSLVVGMLSFGIDRLTKHFVLSGQLGPGHIVWFVDMTLHQNYGLMADTRLPGVLMGMLIIIALGFLLLALRDAWRRRDSMACLALSVVLGGALGNLYDRLFLGYVLDWLMFFHLSIINLADAMIAFGLVLYIAAYFRTTHEKDVDCQKPTTDGLAAG